MPVMLELNVTGSIGKVILGGWFCEYTKVSIKQLFFIHRF